MIVCRNEVGRYLYLPTYLPTHKLNFKFHFGAYLKNKSCPQVPQTSPLVSLLRAHVDELIARIEPRIKTSWSVLETQ